MFKAPAASAFFVNCIVMPSLAFSFAAATAMKSVVIAGPEVKPQDVLAGPEFSQIGVCQGHVICDGSYFWVRLTAGRCRKVLICLVPHLIGAHPLTVELVGSPLDGNLHFRYFGVVKGLSVGAKGCCAATFSRSIKMPFMLRAGTVRLMFQTC